ncbi:MAG: carbon starvation protein, partial [Pseudomonas sp.]|uniref:carbon starvation CstA family protein n=1 Tax=Pseudomonas sp. TaxID=306 RepID=UPI0026311B1B
CVAMWGYLLYQGVIDPLGGINTLWPLFGISNQMLAGIALMLATVVLIKMKRQRYIWVPLLPAVWLLICTTTAGYIKLFDPSPAVGFLALANKYRTALDAGQVLAPAKTIDQMQHVIFNAYTNATLTALFLFVVFSIMFYAIKVGIAAWSSKERTDKEAPFQAMPEAR